MYLHVMLNHTSKKGKLMSVGSSAVYTLQRVCSPTHPLRPLSMQVVLLSRPALLDLLRVRGSKELVPLGYLNAHRGYTALQCLSKQ